MRPYRHPLQNRPPVPSRDGNSAGGLGSLDFGLQRTLPDIDFPPPRPPLSSLHFGPRPLLSPSFSLTLNIVVGFAILLALIAPRSLILPIRPSLCPSFSPLLTVLLFLLFISRSERVLVQAATNLAPPNKMCQGLARSTALHSVHTHTHTHHLLFSPCTTAFLTFRRVDLAWPGSPGQFRICIST